MGSRQACQPGGFGAALCIVAGATPDKRIYLVVIDDSPESRVALQFAARRAAKTDGGVEVLAIVVMAMAFSFLATLYPAFKAASTDPVQVLRYE